MERSWKAKNECGKKETGMKEHKELKKNGKT